MILLHFLRDTLLDSLRASLWWPKLEIGTSVSKKHDFFGWFFETQFCRFIYCFKRDRRGNRMLAKVSTSLLNILLPLCSSFCWTRQIDGVLPRGFSNSSGTRLPVPCRLLSFSKGSIRILLSTYVSSEMSGFFVAFCDLPWGPYWNVATLCFYCAGCVLGGDQRLYLCSYGLLLLASLIGNFFKFSFQALKSFCQRPSGIILHAGVLCVSFKPIKRYSAFSIDDVQQ